MLQDILHNKGDNFSDTARIENNTTKKIEDSKLPPVAKEAFVNEQVTKFFEIPIKESKPDFNEDSNRLKEKEIAESASPLFQKSTKAPQRQLSSSKTSIERSTASPAITVTSWEETNKGQDELTHGSHIRHPNSIDPLSHTSSNTISRYQKQVSETKSMKSGSEVISAAIDNGRKTKKAYDGDAINDKKHIKFHDSLNHSVSPTRQEEGVRKTHGIQEENHSEMIENRDSLEENVTSDKISVDKDSLTESSGRQKNNGEGYFDSISAQDDYTITESEEVKPEQPPKKKLVLPTSISFNDSFSSDTSQLNTSLDVSIDSVTNPNGIRKADSGATLDSLEHQIKDVNPVLSRIQNERMPSNSSFEMHSQHNHPTFTMPHQSPVIHSGTEPSYGVPGMEMPKKQINHLSNNIMDPSLSRNKPITTSLASPAQYANAPRPILSNTSYLFGKTAMPYIGYGHNLHLYNISSNNNIDGTPHNNRASKQYPQHPYNPTPLPQSRSPSMARSQSHPVASQQQQLHSSNLPNSDLIHENFSSGANVIKDGLQSRPGPHMSSQANPLGQVPNIPNHQQNQSVVKMAAERMKRKFLGWN